MNKQPADVKVNTTICFLSTGFAPKTATRSTHSVRSKSWTSVGLLGQIQGMAQLLSDCSTLESHSTSLAGRLVAVVQPHG
jgi:hypothetical protein